MKTTIRWLALWLPVLCLGCQAAGPGNRPHVFEHGDVTEQAHLRQVTQASPGPDCLVWSKEVAAAVPYWREQASLRWPGRRIVFFSCHGGALRNQATGLDEWWTAPDPPRASVPVPLIAQTLHDLYPDAVVVMLCCNPGAVELHVPGVAWAQRNVWIYPNTAYTLLPWNYADAVGNVWEFKLQE